MRPSAATPSTHRALRQAVAAQERALRDDQRLVERLQRHPPTWIRYAAALTARSLWLQARSLQLQVQLDEWGHHH
jgi:hypothetical protein